jgi:hypothetical protein
MRLAALTLSGLVGGLVLIASMLHPNPRSESTAGTQANGIPAGHDERVQLCMKTQLGRPTTVNLPIVTKEAICSCVLREISQSFQPQEEMLLLEIIFFDTDPGYLDARIGEWSEDEQMSFVRRADESKERIHSLCFNEGFRAKAANAIL